MSLLLIGSSGVMGKRYRAILESLNVGYVAIDTPMDFREFTQCVRAATKIIAATPTITHLSILEDIEMARRGCAEKIDVLCEKPVVSTWESLKELETLVSREPFNLYVVNQYQYLPGIRTNATKGPSHYDYYNSGKDGKYWDCFQIIALAKDEFHIENKSPVWKCCINGVDCNLSQMDSAYVHMIDDFLGEKKHLWGMDVIESATRKILAL